MNTSRYTLAYPGCNLLTALKRIYPPTLRVEVITDGDEKEVELQQVELLTFPLLVYLECSPVYNFYQCLPDWTHNHETNLNGEEQEVADTVRTFIQMRIAKPKSEIVSPITLASTYPQLITILKTCPEVHKLAFIQGLGLILGVGVQRAQLLLLTERELKEWVPYNLDLDDGFYTEDTEVVTLGDPQISSTPLSQLNKAFNNWKRNGFQGEFLTVPQ